jgi:hypothetical protein
LSPEEFLILPALCLSTTIRGAGNARVKPSARGVSQSAPKAMVFVYCCFLRRLATPVMVKNVAFCKHRSLSFRLFGDNSSHLNELFFGREDATRALQMSTCLFSHYDTPTLLAPFGHSRSFRGSGLEFLLWRLLKQERRQPKNASFHLRWEESKSPPGRSLRWCRPGPVLLSTGPGAKASVMECKGLFTLPSPQASRSLCVSQTERRDGIRVIAHSRSVSYGVAEKQQRTL